MYHTTPRTRPRRLYGPFRAMGMCSDGYVRERERERVRRRGSILTIRHLLRGVYERADDGQIGDSIMRAWTISEWWLGWLDRCVVALVGGLVVGVLGGWLFVYAYMLG